MGAIPLTKGGPADGENYEYHWTGEYAHAHCLSDVGKKRSHNEDSCILCAPEDRAAFHERGMFFAVADGMGGASAGELASRLALETALDRYYSGPGAPIPEMLHAALDAANQRVFEEAEVNPLYHGMGTTVSIVVLHGDCAYIAQVGDSRVYISRAGARAYQVTDDHSLVAEQVRNGYLSEEEARNHSLKNLITRAVGIKNTVKIDLFALNVKQGDALLICSDGLSNMVGDAEISRIMSMSNVQGATRTLIGRALRNGGNDNVTAILLRITRTPPPREMQSGATVVMLPKSGFLGRLRAAVLGKT